MKHRLENDIKIEVDFDIDVWSILHRFGGGLEVKIDKKSIRKNIEKTTSNKWGPRGVKGAQKGHRRPATPPIWGLGRTHPYMTGKPLPP